MSPRLPSLALALVFSGSALAAEEPYSPPKFSEDEIDITIDGHLDEAVWQQIEPRDGMVVTEPDTLVDGDYRTLRRLFYTDKGLYVGVWAEQPPDTLVARLSSRDKFIARDDFSFTLDPSGQGLYGYWFGLNLGDSIEDGTVLPERQFGNQWDGPWRRATATHDKGWSGEIFLPWSMMSMPESDADTREMGYYLSRYVTHRGERWAYPALPPTKPVFLSQLQKIRLEGIDPRQQFTFYPFGAITWNNAEEDNQDSYKTGFDVFWRPSTNLQLTATVNPDFGNVESDNVVVNLSSLETFFPEKRAFFLEGNEIFEATPRARSDGSPTTLVNTRRIGSSPKDPEIDGLRLSDIEENQPSELLGAAKVTGQSGRIRYGFLGAFEDETTLEGTLDGEPFSVLQDGRDFGVARALYEDTRGGGRRALGWMSTLTAHPQEDATTHGLDFHYLTHEGDWNVDGQLLASKVDGRKGYGGFIDTTYSPSRRVRHTLTFDYFDDSLDLNDLGFLRRNDIRGLDYEFRLVRSSNLEHFKETRRSFRIMRKYNRKHQLVNAGYFSNLDLLLKNQHSIDAKLNYYPSRWDDINSEGNGAFRIQGRWDTGVFYETDSAKKLQLGLGYFIRHEDIDGIIRDHEFNVNWRPNDRFSLSLDLLYQVRDGWLIHAGGRDFTAFDSEFWRPRIEADYFLSARQQFRLTLQWAGIKAHENARWRVPQQDGELLPDTRPADAERDFAISRLTFQARYRWEIAPLSDLFVVYTRGSDIEAIPENSFERSFRDALTNPVVDVFVVKLRYRLGN